MPFTLTLSDVEHDAIATAITAGAFAQRNAQLTELLRHNAGYSMANAIEKEIGDLNRAAQVIVFAKRTAEWGDQR